MSCMAGEVLDPNQNNAFLEIYPYVPVGLANLSISYHRASL